MKRTIAALLGLLVAAPAAAAPRRVLVFPLAGSVPNDPGDALTRLTTVVGRAAGLTGDEVVMAQISFEDAATLAGCSSSDPACAGLIVQALNADDAVFGTVTPSGDGKTVDVALTALLHGTTTHKTFSVPAEDPTLMVQRLARDVPVLFVGGEAPPPERTPPPAPVVDPEPAPVEPIPPPAPRDTGFRFGRVGAGAWLLAGAGLVMAGSGVALLIMARDRQDQVDHAPVDTVEDFERLRDLEAEGRRFTIASDVLLIAGGAALITGTVLAIYQGTRHRGAPRRVSFAPLPLRGGAGFAVEVRLP